MESRDCQEARWKGRLCGVVNLDFELLLGTQLVASLKRELFEGRTTRYRVGEFYSVRSEKRSAMD